MVSFLWLLAGLVSLLLGAVWLVDGSTGAARRLGVSNLVVGLTIVAFGTSMPELFVNITACLQKDTDLAVGNILGSNTFNTLWILGLCSLIRPLSVGMSMVWKAIPLSVLAGVMVWILGGDVLLDGGSANLLSRIDGLVLLCFFIIFLYYSYSVAKEGIESDSQGGCPPGRFWVCPVKIGLGLAGLVVGGRWAISGAVGLAEYLDVSQRVIGVTVLAMGTSLPELVTSAVATYKKQVDIAVGNVVGSNIFNIFFILGTSAAVAPLPLHRGVFVDIILVVLSSFLLFVFMFTGKRHALDRWEGVLFVIIFAAYMVWLGSHA